MKLSMISFSIYGKSLAQTIMRALEGTGQWQVDYRNGQETSQPPGSREWLKEQFDRRIPVLFLGAMGIAVRMIAPFVNSKQTDSAVLVMDDAGRYIIPVLSGHLGGANELAYQLAKLLGAVPVITTSTDVHEKFAVDVFAKEHHLYIYNIEGIASISKKVLEEEPVLVSVEPALAVCKNMEKWFTFVPYPPQSKADIVITREKEMLALAKLLLVPKQYVAGIGCRRGIPFGMLRDFVTEQCEAAGISTEDLYAVASIDRKKDEEGLLALAQYLRVPFVTYAKEELLQAGDGFSDSGFVQSQVGVGNVCERAACLCAGAGGKIILRKTAKDGMTIAIACIHNGGK